MLVLVRHGRTAANAAGLLQGHLDLSLDELGERQAAKLAATLASSAQIVVASPLRRARETAARIAAERGLDVVIDDRWIELDYGDFDGWPLGDIPRETWNRWRSDVTFAPPGGESLAALARRVVAACVDWADKASAGDVVVVSHVSPIKAALTWALGVGVEASWRTRLDPASITRIAFGPNGPVLAAFNETGHLD